MESVSNCRVPDGPCFGVEESQSGDLVFILTESDVALVLEHGLVIVSIMDSSLPMIINIPEPLDVDVCELILTSSACQTELIEGDRHAHTANQDRGEVGQNRNSDGVPLTQCYVVSIGVAG